jgi:hypothetical protein
MASIEVAPVHPLAYDGATTDADLGRVTCSNNLFESKDPDTFSWVWQAGVHLRNGNLNYNSRREEDRRQQPAAQQLPRQAL